VVVISQTPNPALLAKVRRKNFSKTALPANGDDHTVSGWADATGVSYELSARVLDWMILSENELLNQNRTYNLRHLGRSMVFSKYRYIHGRRIETWTQRLLFVNRQQLDSWRLPFA
jgi:hypothetical protein